MHYLEGLTTIIEAAKKSDPNTIIFLLGSHAQGIATEKSDVDLLIIHQNKDDLSKTLKKVMKNGSIYPSHQYDVKILNHNELNKVRNKEYFMLYSMIKYGKCLEGKIIRMKYLPQLLQQEYNKLMEQLRQLEEEVLEKKDYQTVAALIFGVGKSLRFMERILKDKCQSLKEIFGNNLTVLEREYEAMTRKQGFIKTSLSQEIKINVSRKSKGNFNRLFQAIQQIQKYGHKISLLCDQLE